MSGEINTGPESSSKIPEPNLIQEAKNRWGARISAVSEEAREKWRNLLGLDLPHAENGHTIEPVPSEVPPVQQDEVIPSSYGNLPIETIPEKPVSLGTPEQQEIKEPEKVQETPQAPAPAPRIITGAVPTKEVQGSKLPRYIGPRPKTEIKEATDIAPLPDFHTVQAGETLYGIAKKYNIGLQNLLSLNGLTEQSTIKITQKIALKQGVKSEPEKKPEEKKLAEGLTAPEHIALILKTCDDLGVTNKAQRAYILATAEHESDGFKTMKEYSHWKLKKYGKADKETGQTYYGRGYVQLTWKTNYEKYDTELKSKGLLSKDKSIVLEPELVKNPKIAAFILVHGMKTGTFRAGETLGKYFDGNVQNWFNAREIVNGDKDRKKEGVKIGTKIADRAKEILQTL